MAFGAASGPHHPFKLVDPGDWDDARPYLLPWGEGGARSRSEWEDEGVRSLVIIRNRP